MGKDILTRQSCWVKEGKQGVLILRFAKENEYKKLIEFERKLNYISPSGFIHNKTTEADFERMVEANEFLVVEYDNKLVAEGTFDDYELAFVGISEAYRGKYSIFKTLAILLFVLSGRDHPFSERFTVIDSDFVDKLLPAYKLVSEALGFEMTEARREGKNAEIYFEQKENLDLAKLISRGESELEKLGWKKMKISDL